MTVRTWRIIAPGMLLLFLTDCKQAFTQLKITSGGMRNVTDGSFAFTTSDGLYWTSSRNPGTWVSIQFNFGEGAGGPAYGQASMRTNGLSVRCIKD